MQQDEICPANHITVKPRIILYGLATCGTIERCLFLESVAQFHKKMTELHQIELQIGG